MTDVPLHMEPSISAVSSREIGASLPERQVVSGNEMMFDNDPELHDIMEVHGLGREGFPNFWKDPLGLRDFKADALRRMGPRLLCAFMVWCVGLYFNNVTQAWLQQFMAGYYESRWKPVPPLTPQDTVRLWDIGFYLFDPLDSTELVDLVAGSVPALVVVRFFIVPGPLSMRWTVLCRLLFVWGILWALRGVSIVSTVLPNPDHSCKPKVTFPDNYWLEAWANMPFVFWHSEMTCQDVLFSGHTVGLTLATLIWIRYLPWTPWYQWAASTGLVSFASLLKFILLMTMFAGYYVIIASKFHYSCDVFMGMMLTVMVFQVYHSAVRMAFLPRQRQPQVLRCSLYPFIRWFEADAADVAVLKLCIRRQEQMSMF